MLVIIVMVFYIYALIGMEFLNKNTSPQVQESIDYNPQKYSDFTSLPMALLTLF